MGVLDHLVVAAGTLDEGVAHVAAALGQAPGPGGRHAAMATHNRLLSLGPEDYLEVIAPDPSAETPRRPRWFDLDNFMGPPRLTNWVLRVNNLSDAIANAPDGIGAPMAFRRGDYRWQMAVPADGRLPFDGIFPALIAWQTEPPAPALPDAGARLVALTLDHPRAGDLGRALARITDCNRVVVRNGPAAIRAVIHTPEGERELT